MFIDLFIYLFSSKLGRAEQEASDDAADRQPQHLPRPPGPDHRAGVHRPGPVSVRVHQCLPPTPSTPPPPINQKIRNDVLKSILPSSHPSRLPSSRPLSLSVAPLSISGCLLTSPDISVGRRLLIFLHPPSHTRTPSLTLPFTCFWVVFFLFPFSFFFFLAHRCVPPPPVQSDS